MRGKLTTPRPRYAPRVVDTELDELLGGLAAVAIDGAKGVGKTATAQRRTNRTVALDDPASMERVSADPSVIDRGSGAVLIDEWQRLPSIWDHVRRKVDAGALPGTYLLTGSAIPVSAPVHSGAGRIVSVRMRPLSLFERLIADGVDLHDGASIADLLRGGRPAVGGDAAVDLSWYVEQIIASGFPGIRLLPDRARRAQLDGYVDRIVEREFAEQGHLVRRKALLRAWLIAYAAATAGTASYNALARAATPGEADPPARDTAAAYRDVLTELFVLDPVPGWTPGRNHLNKAAQAPKHHLVDPALAARLLGLDADALLLGIGGASQPPAAAPRDGTILGALFESLVTQSIRTYAQAAEARVRHFRTNDGRHEVDLIIERPDQRVVAVEVKLSRTVSDKSVRQLRWLSNALGDDLVDSVVVTAGPYAYRREDGIAVVPAALLRP